MSLSSTSLTSGSIKFQAKTNGSMHTTRKPSTDSVDTPAPAVRTTLVSTLLFGMKSSRPEGTSPIANNKTFCEIQSGADRPRNFVNESVNILKIQFRL